MSQGSSKEYKQGGGRDMSNGDQTTGGCQSEKKSHISTLRTLTGSNTAVIKKE